MLDITCWLIITCSNDGFDWAGIAGLSIDWAGHKLAELSISWVFIGWAFIAIGWAFIGIG